MIPSDASFTFDTTSSHRLFCVVEHWAQMHDGPTRIFVGVTDMKDLTQCGVQRKNTEWSKLYKAGGWVTVRVLQYGLDREELLVWARAYVQTLDEKPICNAKGQQNVWGKRAVRCLETGEVFPSLTAAARWIGMPNGAMSIAIKSTGRAGGYNWEYAGG